MNKIKQKLMDKVLLIALGLNILFAWFDAQNIVAIKSIDASWQAMGGWSPTNNVWNIFWDIISPALFNMWIGVLFAIGLIWYFVSKDKSEALAIFLAPALLIWFGAQDVIYYIISPDVLSECVGCWADVMLPVRIISDLLGETCPTATSFLLSAGLGVIVSYNVYNYLRNKW